MSLVFLTSPTITCTPFADSPLSLFAFASAVPGDVNIAIRPKDSLVSRIWSKMNSPMYPVAPNNKMFSLVIDPAIFVLFRKIDKYSEQEQGKFE
jgi:hypothetical protein